MLKELPEYLDRQYSILELVLENIALFNTIMKYTKMDEGVFERPDRYKFWINAGINALKIAIIDWCKVIDCEDDNQLYNYEPALGKIDSFRKHMIQIRDQYIVANNIKESPKIDFDRMRGGYLSL